MRSPTNRSVRSQTLERALRALHVLVDGRARTSHELADALGLPRSNVYRILRTFEDFAFVTRLTDGRYTLGLGLAAIADASMRAADLRTDEVLSELADTTAATAIFCIPQLDDAVVLSSVRPGARPASVAIRRGSRLSLISGAPGMAILSLRPPEEGQADEVALARSTGYVHTKGSPFVGFEAVAASVRLRDGQASSVAVVFPRASLGLSDVLPALRHAAVRLAQPVDDWTE